MTRLTSVLLAAVVLASACGSSSSVLAGDTASQAAPTSAQTPAAEAPAAQPDASPEPAATATPIPAPDATAEPAADADNEEAPLASTQAAPSPGAEIAPAVFDELNEGEVEQVLGIDAWSFDAVAGQLLTIDVIETGGGCSQDVDLVLLDPSGEVAGLDEWISSGQCYGYGPVELAQSGEYFIEFRGGDGSVITRTTGAYSFVPSFLTQLDSTELVFDELIEAEISQLLGSQAYTFEGGQGDWLTVDVVRTDDGCSQDVDLVLLDPSGEVAGLDEWISSGQCYGYRVQLESAGEHRLEFRGGDGSIITRTTGEYAFVASFLTQFDNAELVFDEVIEGEISQLFGSQVRTFEGVEGDWVTVDVLSSDGGCSQDLDLVLIDPRDQVTSLDEWISSGRCHGYRVELESTGEYRLEFRGGSGSIITRTTGDYSFVASFLTEVDRSDLAFGSVIEAELSQLFGTDIYAFDGAEGQMLIVEVISVGDGCRQDIDLVLIDPFGENGGLDKWISSGQCKAYGPIELERSGEYQLEFRGGDGAVIDRTTGPYSFSARLDG